MVLQRHDYGSGAVLTFTAADVEYLRSQAGAAALGEVAGYALSDTTRIADISAIRRRFGQHSAALVETTVLRRKAVVKFAGIADVSTWLFTDEALQQATAGAVAHYRAQRLTGAVVHDATCSIGTELVALRGTAAQVLGSDTDRVRLAMAQHNVADVVVCCADALHPISREAVVLLDPARRCDGRRRVDPGSYQPPLNDILERYRSRTIVVKCAPGIDVTWLRQQGFDGEIEITSVQGSVREACLWSPALAGPGVRRRATVMMSASGGVTEVITDTESDDCPTRAPGRWIIDPDPAVVRAGLVRHYGARHGLWQLDPHIAYLTGDELPPAVRGFEILDQLPLREKYLRQALSARDCGALEILVRGVDVNPDRLRHQFRLTGQQALSMVITRIGTGTAGHATVFLCRACR